MSRSAGHPRLELNPLIHASVRLSVMAIVARSEKVDFRFIGDALDVSDSLLSKHLAVLDKAGYIRSVKVGSGNRSRTWISPTPEGRAAFAAYRRALSQIVGTEDGG